MNTLYTALPMFQRVGSAAYKKDLKNITALCNVLANPHRQFKSIHVAGTNGKGSSCHMLAAILQCAGCKTGLHTSPHLKRFTERIKVNGEEVSEAFVVDFVEKMKPHMKRIAPSFFELTVAMAFAYFAEQQVDIAVVEVGLGGRLDSTNIVDPLASLITRIGYDHQYLLGDTLPRIAHEKAGIIKPGKKTIIAETQAETKDVFLRKGKDVGAVVEFAEDRYRVEVVGGESADTIEVHRMGEVAYRLVPGLSGTCQRKNIVGVLGVVDELNRQGFNIPPQAVEQGIADVTRLTGLKGRWQQLGASPAVYCDVAHNEEGIRTVLEEFKKLHYNALHVVFGMVKDKPPMSLLRLLPPEGHYYFCQADLPRSLPADELQKEGKVAGLQGKAVTDVNEAIRQAKLRAAPDDLIFIGGSTFVVAEIEGL